MPGPMHGGAPRGPYPPGRRAPRAGRPRGRRSDLSLDAVLDRTIAMLDATGQAGLTLRGLAAGLETGVGSIYWYVDGKDSLVDLATDQVLGRALDDVHAMRDGSLDPSEIDADGDFPAQDPQVARALSEIRRICLALYHQITQHPWLAPRLLQVGAVNRNARRTWDQVGRQLMTLDLTPFEKFYGTSAVVNYVTGVAAAMDPGDRVDPRGGRSREEILAEIAASWVDEDDDLPFIRATLEQFRTHDDADQFAAGLDLMLAGLRDQAES